MLKYASKASFGNVSYWYGLGNKNIISDFFLYIKNFIFEGTSIFYGALFTFCTITLLIKRKNIFKDKGLILSWMVGALFFLIIAKNKSIQFVLPVLIPFAILLGIILNECFKKLSFIVLAMPLLIFLLYPFGNIGIYRKIFKPPLINSLEEPATKEIVNLISKERSSSYLVACAVDHEFFNDFTSHKKRNGLNSDHGITKLFEMLLKERGIPIFDRRDAAFNFAFVLLNPQDNFNNHPFFNFWICTFTGIRKSFRRKMSRAIK